MKRCPRCSRVYADETFRFCLDDGADLAVFNEAKTEKLSISAVGEIKKSAPQRRPLVFLIVGLIGVLLIFALSVPFLYFTFGGVSNNSPNNSIPLFGVDDETEIKNIMQKLSVAFVENDTKTLDYYLADEYKEENSHGETFTKKDVMKPPEIGERVSLDYSDLKVSVSGDKATVSGKGASKYRILGTVVPINFTFKSELVRRDGHWQGVYSYTEYSD